MNPTGYQSASAPSRRIRSQTQAAILDTLGREVISIAHNKYQDKDSNNNVIVIEEKYLTFTKLDAESKPLLIRDARGNLVMQYFFSTKADNDPSNELSVNCVTGYDIANNLLFQHSISSG